MRFMKRVQQQQQKTQDTLKFFQGNGIFCGI